MKIGDLGISVKLKPLATEDEVDDTEYNPKGLRLGYSTLDIETAFKKQSPVKRDILIKNDQYAIQATFTKTLITL